MAALASKKNNLHSLKKRKLQVYVMWLPLLLNTALPLALLLSLNSFVYARLVSVGCDAVDEDEIDNDDNDSILALSLSLLLLLSLSLSLSLFSLSNVQLRSRMRRTQEGTLRRRERRMAR